MLTGRAQRNGQAGAVLILGMFIIAVCLAFSALVIDLLQTEGTVAKLQAVCDAGSNAGALELRTAHDTTDPKNEKWQPAKDDKDALVGWNYARKAVFATLNANFVLGISRNHYSPCLKHP